MPPHGAGSPPAPHSRNPGAADLLLGSHTRNSVWLSLISSSRRVTHPCDVSRVCPNHLCPVVMTFHLWAKLPVAKLQAPVCLFPVMWTCAWDDPERVSLHSGPSVSLGLNEEQNAGSWSADAGPTRESPIIQQGSAPPRTTSHARGHTASPATRLMGPHTPSHRLVSRLWAARLLPCLCGSAHALPRPPRWWIGETAPPTL